MWNVTNLEEIYFSTWICQFISRTFVILDLSPVVFALITCWCEDCGVVVLPCGPHDQDAEEAQPLSPTLKRGRKNWRELDVWNADLMMICMWTNNINAIYIEMFICNHLNDVFEELFVSCTLGCREPGLCYMAIGEQCALCCSRNCLQTTDGDMRGEGLPLMNESSFGTVPVDR